MVLKSESASIESTFTVRPVTMDDLQNAIDLFNAADFPYLNENIHTVEDLETEWKNPRFDLNTSTRAVFNDDGLMVGYMEVYDFRSMPVRPMIWGRIHPDYEGQGIGTYLYQWVENRSKEVFERVPEDAAVTIFTGDLEKKTGARKFFEAMGMHLERSSYTMLIEMDEKPEAQTLPEGIRIITYPEYEGPMENVYEGVRGSFQDHRGYVEEPFDEGFSRWKDFWTNDPHYDPAVWLLAMDGDKIAGISLCRAQSHDGEDRGHVMQLGVMREYRRRGIAMALLTETFRMFWERGKKKVDLGVDGSSITNAVALYERAGMHIDKAYMVYEKQLRDGIEYSNQG